MSERQEQEGCVKDCALQPKEYRAEVAFKGKAGGL